MKVTAGIVLKEHADAALNKRAAARELLAARPDGGNDDARRGAQAVGQARRVHDADDMHTLAVFEAARLVQHERAARIGLQEVTARADR